MSEGNAVGPGLSRGGGVSTSDRGRVGPGGSPPAAWFFVRANGG